MKFILTKSIIILIFHFTPFISIGNILPRLTINYKDHPADSILNYYIKKVASNNTDIKYKIVISKSAVFADFETIKRIEDSLMKNNISFTSLENVYDVNLLKTEELRSKQLLLKTDYYETNFFSNMNVPGYESEKGLDLIYVGRTIDDNGKNSLVKIISLKTPDPIPQFPIDSIGFFDDKFSFDNVDAYVNSLKTYDTSNLAVLITKPFSNELEKVRAIFMWMNKNIQYDYVGLASNNYTVDVPDVLRKRVAVCDGYSRLFYYLCSGGGITSNYLRGLTPRGVHAWNSVRIDSKWYLIDVTWGLEYFLTSPNIFIKDHIPMVFNKWTLLTNRIPLEDWKKEHL